MAEQDHNTSSVDPLIGPLLDQWATCVRQANETTSQLMGGLDVSSDPRRWRRQWFEVLGGSTENYLRSPPFLQVMKVHIDTLINAKRHFDTLPKQAASSERRSVRSRPGDFEEAMQTRLELLEKRLDALEAPSRERSEVEGWEQFLNALRARGTTPRATMGVTPHDVVHQEGSWQLVRYRNDSVRFAEPVLICFALVNRPYILDLQRNRSVVRQLLLERGFDVYLIDWGVPEAADRGLRLSDYVCQRMNQASNVACKLSASQELNLLGYCMGGTMSTMFTALYPQRVRNLVLMAAPIDFGGEEGMLNLWAREDCFDVDKLIDTFGNCPGEFLQYCFQLMKPVQNFAEKYLAVCEKLDDKAFLENFLAMERWANDSIPVAGETFREYVKSLYQKNRLVKGGMSLGGSPVKLSEITCPLLLLVAEKDHLVPPGSTLALKQHVRSKDVKSMSINAGHIGLAVSSKAHGKLWPDAADWLAEHSTTRV